MRFRWLVVLLAGLAPISAAAVLLPPSVLVSGQSDRGAAWYIALNQASRSTLNAGSTAHVSVYPENTNLGRIYPSQHEQILATHIGEMYREKPLGIPSVQ